MMRLTPLCFLATMLASTFSARASDPITVDCDFPGGNILVDKIDGAELTLRPDVRDTAGDWFYWYCRVRNAAGKPLQIHFDRASRIGARGPGVSLDGGETWRWLGRENINADGVSFHYDVPDHAEDLRFCFAFPYVESNLHAFLQQYAGDPHLKVDSLCRSEHGRDVELLHVGRLDGDCEHRVAFTARHHCCEMMASFVLEGIVEEILADTDDGRWLRDNVEFWIVPLVDKDGVEQGDQGKNRLPYDHNRDYGGDSRYAAIRAIREQLPAWSAGRMKVGMDIHCPGPKGASEERVFLVGGPNAGSWREIGRLSDLLEANLRGPIPYHRENNIPFGVAWNSAAKLNGRKPFSHFAADLPGVTLGTTLEVAYANAGGTEVNPQTARALGRDVAHALRLYLTSPAAQ